MNQTALGERFRDPGTRVALALGGGSARGLAHIVITSVDRDDLADGGAAHFAETITAIRNAAPAATIEP